MRLVLIAVLLLSMVEVGVSAERTLVIHLDKKKIIMENDGSYYDDSLPNALNFYPDKKVNIKINDGSVEIIVLSASHKSDTGGLFYIRKDHGRENVVNYAKVYGSSVLGDFFSYDVDKDGIEDIVSYWVDEYVYIVRVDKILNNGRKIVPIFNSRPFTIPYEYQGKLLSIGSKGLILTYDFQGKLKEGIITINPDDPTHEPYIRPLGWVILPLSACAISRI